MFEQIKLIQATLTRTADEVNAPESGERAPLKPYKDLGKAPANFPYKERTLLPPDDARTIRQGIDKLDELVATQKEIIAGATSIRTEATAKAKAYEEEHGLEKTGKDIQELTNSIGEQVRDINDRFEGGALVEYKGKVMAVYNEIKKGAVKDEEKMTILIDLLTKAVAPEVLNPILEGMDQIVENLVIARTKVEEAFGSWKSPDDLRKKVKQEVPKGASEPVAASRKMAGPFDSIKSLIKGIISKLRDIFEPVHEAVADTASAIENLEPISAELDAALADGVTAGKKTAGNQYRDWLEHNVGDVQEAMDVVDALAGHLEFMSDTDSRALPLANKLWAAL